MPERILIIEDEDKISRLLELELSYEGYYIEKADMMKLTKQMLDLASSEKEDNLTVNEIEDLWDLFVFWNFVHPRSFMNLWLFWVEKGDYLNRRVQMKKS